VAEDQGAERLGWNRLGMERYLHLSTNVMVYRLGPLHIWRVVTPANGIDADVDAPLSWGYAVHALELAESIHVLRVQHLQEGAFDEAHSEYYQRKLDGFRLPGMAL